MKTANIIMKCQADKSWIKTVDDHDHHWQEQAANKSGYKSLDTAAVAIIALLIIVIFAVTIGR